MRFWNLLSFPERRRRSRLRAQPIGESWREILRKNVRQYSLLPESERAKLEVAVRVFVAEKDWEPCGGLEMSEEIQVTVAGQASLLTLGFDDFYFDELRAVVVYPSSFLTESRDAEIRVVIGQAHQDGAVVLSWEDARSPETGGSESINVVIHEFAHILDMHAGGADGSPPIDDADFRREWDSLMDSELGYHQQTVAEDVETVLSSYGSRNRAEFFSVASETFFENPAGLARERPDLFSMLSRWYRQDPTTWQSGEAVAGSVEHGWQIDDESIESRIAELTGVIARHPDYREAYVDRACVYELSEQWDRAIADYDRALELDPVDVNVLCDRASAWRRQGDLDAAIADFDRAIEILPEFAHAYFERASVYMQRNRLNEASADLDRAIELDAECADAYDQRAYLRSLEQDWAGARADADRAIDLDPNIAGAYVTRGSYHVDQGDHASAIADFDRAVELLPDSGFPYQLRGEAYLDGRDFSRARADLDEAIRLDASDGYNRLLRGDLDYDERRFDDAIDHYSEAIRLSPEDPSARHNRGAAGVWAGRFRDAIEDLSGALLLDPECDRSHAFRSLARFESGELDGALADADEALRRDPECSLAYYARSRIRAARGDPEGERSDRRLAARFRQPHEPWGLSEDG